MLGEGVLHPEINGPIFKHLFERGILLYKQLRFVSNCELVWVFCTLVMVQDSSSLAFPALTVSRIGVLEETVVR